MEKLMQGDSRLVDVTESSQVFEARRVAVELARTIDGNENFTGKIALAATEAATNLVKHARQGVIFVSRCYQCCTNGVELIALDRGPGLHNASESLRDGVSSTGTCGTGLGALRRLASEFDIFSEAGKGTALVVRLFPGNTAPAAGPALHYGGLLAGMRGETVCGDGWCVREEGNVCRLLMADGLGHGPGAYEASSRAVEIMGKVSANDPVDVIESVHLALRATRGAAVAVACIDTAKMELRYAGLGNICGVTFDGVRTQYLVSQNGTAGHNMRKLHSFAYPWSAGATLVMHSDGLTSGWKFESYPGLFPRHPSVIAAVLFRDAARNRDDAGILVANSCIPRES